MLSLDFADTAIIETIATAKTIMAIVPNSGTTCVPTISISVVVASNGIISLFPIWCASSLSSPLTRTKNEPSLNGVMISSESVMVNSPSSSAMWIETSKESSPVAVILSTIPPLML